MCCSLLIFSPRLRARFVGHADSVRLLKLCEGYVSAVVSEAELREKDEILDLESFIILRRQNSAVPLCFGVIEYAYGINLPDDVCYEPNFIKAQLAGIDMVCWSNVGFH